MISAPTLAAAFFAIDAGRPRFWTVVASGIFGTTGTVCAFKGRGDFTYRVLVEPAEPDGEDGGAEPANAIVDGAGASASDESGGGVSKCSTRMQMPA